MWPKGKIQEACNSHTAAHQLAQSRIATGILWDSPGVPESARALPAGLGAGPGLFLWLRGSTAPLQFTSAPCHPPVFNMPGPAPSGTNVGSSGVLSQQSSGGPGSRIHRQAEEECQLWNTERRPYDLSGHWGDVAIQHRGFTRAQSGPCSSIGYESSVHRFCIYVAHLGQVHSFIDSATSICLSSEERKKSQHILDQKHSDFLFMRNKFSASLLFYKELNKN